MFLKSVISDYILKDNSKKGRKNNQYMRVLFWDKKTEIKRLTTY